MSEGVLNEWLVSELAETREELAEKNRQLADTLGRLTAMELLQDKLFETHERLLENYTTLVKENENLRARLDRFVTVGDV